MAKLRLSLACWNYDRTRALLEGAPVDGVELTYLNLPVEETFFRMLRHHEFDVAEMSLSSYMVSRFQEDPPFVAIPIFPSRVFRHSCIYVHADSGIREPQDLVGKRIGCPEYQMTAPLYERHPWLAQSFYKGFYAAHQQAYAELHQSAALKLMLPWLGRHVEETEAVMGADFWPQGFAPNGHVLNTFVRYHYEQGLSKRQLTPQELFAPETFESFKI